MKRKVWTTANIVVGLAVSGGLGWLAARGLNWSAVWVAFEETSLSLLALSVAMFMLSSYLKAIRWKILFINEKVSTPRLFIVQNEGLGVNNLVPIRIASEATQMAVLTVRDRINGATALATLGMERVIDVVASTLILGVAFFLVPEMKNFTLYVWGAIGFTIVAVAVVRFLAWSSDALAFIRRISFLSKFTTAVKDLERQRLRLAASLGVSIVLWLLVGLTAWVAAIAIGLPVSPITATLVILGTIFFATAVPAAPGAIGTFEFAAVYVLDIFGVPKESAFGFAVITHVIFFLPSTIIAAVFLPREGIVSFHRARRLAAQAERAGDGSA